MTHYVKTVFSDKTICGRLTFEVLRIDDDVTPTLPDIDCPHCITKIESVVLTLKNNNPVIKDQ